MMKRQQSQWKSSTGFILASAGSAIGLGAMWKFPYMGDLWRRCLSSYVLNIHHFVGLPLLIMEFTVGKMGRTYTTQIYSKLTGKNGSISLAGTVIWQCLFYLASIVLSVVGLSFTSDKYYGN